MKPVPPKDLAQKQAVYRAQNGTGKLTPRQARRLRHKTHRAQMLAWLAQEVAASRAAATQAKQATP